MLLLQEGRQLRIRSIARLGISYKSAWFMTHRIREALRSGLSGAAHAAGPRSSEADETYIGRKEGVPKGKHGYQHKVGVLTLIDRKSGEARSFQIDKSDAQNIMPIVRANVAKETAIVTDEASLLSPT